MTTKIDEIELKRQYRRIYYEDNKDRIQKYQKKYYKEKREETTQEKNDIVRPYKIHKWKGEQIKTIRKTIGIFIISFN
tara:strand:- start:2012 stop:2245 length:234 start_codon:yes stop_codon:yes gene_type:complete